MTKSPSPFILIAFFLSAVWGTAQAQAQAQAQDECPTDSPAYEASSQFRQALELDREPQLRAAWSHLNKNGQGQTVLRKCFRDSVGTALRNNNYRVADLLLSNEFNFSIDE